MGILRIQSPKGDSTLTWDPADIASTEVAKDTFEKHRAQGFLGYRTLAVNSALVRERPQVKGESITTFDPQAKEIVMTVPMVGG